MCLYAPFETHVQSSCSVISVEAPRRCQLVLHLHRRTARSCFITWQEVQQLAVDATPPSKWRTSLLLDKLSCIIDSKVAPCKAKIPNQKSSYEILKHMFLDQTLLSGSETALTIWNISLLRNIEIKLHPSFFFFAEVSGLIWK